MHGMVEDTLRIRRTRPYAGGAREKIMRLALARREQALIFSALFLIALVRCFSMPSPYAILCVAALMYHKKKVTAAYLGVCAASLFRLLWGQTADFGQAFACALLLPLLYWSPGTQKGLTVFVGVVLAMRGALDAIEMFTIEKAMLAVASVALGVATLPSVIRAVQLLTERRGELSPDDVTCLALPLVMLVAGLSSLRLLSVNPGFCAAFFAVMLCAWLYGVPSALCVGAIAGFALMMAGHGALMSVTLTLGGVCCGLLRGRKRVMVFLLMPVVSAGVMYVLMGGIAWQVMTDAALAGMGFLLLGSGTVKRLKRAISVIRKAAPGDDHYLKMRVRQWVSNVESIIASLPEPAIPAPDAESLCEEFASLLCEGCDGMTICWHEEYERSKRAAMRVIDASGEQEQLIACVNSLYASCGRISAIPSLAMRFERDRQARLKRMLNADYERKMLATHLSALSEAVQLISLEDVADEDAESGEWLAAVHDALQATRFPARALFVRRIDGHFAVCLQIETLAKHCLVGDEIRHAIGVRLGVGMDVAWQKGCQALLTQTPPYALSIGTATTCAVTPERKNLTYSVENGDAVFHDSLLDGRVFVALSDGMGHGEDAKRESRKTLEMLYNCLQAGYSRAQAMTAVNGMMLSATGGEQFATVDLCVFDQWTGESTLDKLGACASYIIQGQRVHVIESAALPLGVIAHVIPAEYRFKLAPGDTVLMMSDGASDLFDDEAELKQALTRFPEDAPQQIADTVLQNALIRVNGMPKDDMTVVCFRVESRQAMKAM